MKTIKFTNTEIEFLKNILDSYISYILATGVDENNFEVQACKLFFEKLDKVE